jgi:serine protease Do
VKTLLALLLVLLVADVVDARSWAWLGVRIRDLSEQEVEEISRRHGIDEGFGVVIVEVLAGTPAERAGMRNGDIVVAFNGRPVVDTRLLQRLIAAAPTGEETRLTVLRPEGREPLPVRLVEMPRTIAGERVAAEFGFVMREQLPQPELAGRRAAGVSAPVVGLVVRGGAAEKAGLQTGDVVLQVGERAVLTHEAAAEALSEMSLDRPLPIVVRRGDDRLSFTLPAPG